MSTTISRRKLLAGATLAALGWRTTIAQQTPPATPAAQHWSLPIRDPGGIPGNGFLIRHGFAAENTWFNPGWWHTAEDWYRADDRETAGAEVLAVTEGEVTWIGSEYPGRVVLVQHPEGLYGMYGHLDPDLEVAEGDRVAAGQVLGRVLRWTDGRAPSHLHFEIRDFFQNPIVNGDMPAYSTGCSYQCPPGPGYWPIGDDRHPAEVGYRNPSHVIAKGMASDPPLRVVVASTADRMAINVREAPDVDSSVSADRFLEAGERFDLRAIDAGAPDSDETSALGYDVWYEVELPGGESGWVRAFRPDSHDTGSDGGPSSLRPVLLPVGTGGSA